MVVSLYLSAVALVTVIVYRTTSPGVAPIPASSGKTVRYRLNRSGDRQLNRALHNIALSRLRFDPTTRAYATRRRAEAKTDLDIRRCLKRYIARQLFRQLEAGTTAT